MQAYEGVCIARKNNGVNSKFTVRKISHGEGVERVFPLLSPAIDTIEVIRKGDVRRSKLYYLRDRTGKSARISNRDRGEEADQYALDESQEVAADIKELQENSDDSISIKKNTEKLEKGAADSVEVIDETVTKVDKLVEKKSESAALKADKTKDESKT